MAKQQQCTADQVAAELERGRRLYRRRMARASFGLLAATSALIVAALVFSPSRGDIAAALSAASAVLITLLTCFVTIVLGYLGFSAAERTINRKDD